MAIFKGRDDLFKSLNEATRHQDKKGLEAEIEIGNLLSNNLPDDTYVIAHPVIGELQPDFLVISPRYGFRIVEVKNFSIRYVEEAFSNGSLKTPYGKVNPLEQVKKHVDAFKNYLISNHPNLGIEDPYKMIGYCVIHKGFSKREFEYKFGRQLSKWSATEKEDYFKYHLFYSDLGHNMDSSIYQATKFTYKKFTLHRDLIKEISDNVKYTLKKNVDEVFDWIDEQEEKMDKVNNEIKQIKEGIESYRINSIQVEKNESIQKKKGKLKMLLLPVIGILAIIITFAVIYSQGSIGIFNNVVTSNSDVLNSLSNLDNFQDDYIKLEAKVNKFYYDSKSGTKFLTLSDGEQEIEAVIFKDTKVPFIEEGENLVFEGYIQSTMDGKSIELRIERIDK